MKKTIITFMIMLGLLMMTACGGAAEGSGDTSQNNAGASDALTFTVNDYVVTFDMEDSIQNLNFLTSIDLRQSWGSHSNPTVFDLIYDDSPSFKIHMEYDGGTYYDYTDGERSSLDELTDQTEEINGIVWHVTANQDDERIRRYYWYVDNEGVYNIGFTVDADSSLDVDELANTFMSGVTPK